MLTGIAGALIGGVVGYLIGSKMSKIGGGCPILCNKKISTIYFAVLGYLIISGI